MDDTKKKTKKKVVQVNQTRIITKPTEEDLREAVIIFGRFNPPTVGHEMMINKAREIAESKDADLLVYLSHSHDNKKNPLPYNLKLDLCQEAFGDVVQDAKYKNIFDVLEDLNEEYDAVTIVIGSDRFEEMIDRVTPYNGKLFDYVLEFANIGNRTDESFVSSVSASKVRSLVECKLDIEDYLPEAIRYRKEEIIEGLERRSDFNMAVTTTPDGKKVWRKNKKVLTKDRKKGQDTDLTDKEPDLNLASPYMKEAKDYAPNQVYNKPKAGVYGLLKKKLKKKRNRLLRQYKALEDDG